MDAIKRLDIPAAKRYLCMLTMMAAELDIMKNALGDCLGEAPGVEGAAEAVAEARDAVARRLLARSTDWYDCPDQV